MSTQIVIRLGNGGGGLLKKLRISQETYCFFQEHFIFREMVRAEQTPEYSYCDPRETYGFFEEHFILGEMVRAEQTPEYSYCDPRETYGFFQEHFILREMVRTEQTPEHSYCHFKQIRILIHLKRQLIGYPVTCFLEL